MTRRSRSRGHTPRSDGGSAWISYSDMMAALVLVFVLVLCYVIFQYFSELETKTAAINEKQAQITQQQSELDDKTALLATQQETLDDQQSQLLDKENALNSALTEIETQKGLLNVQQQTLTDQEAEIAAAQAALSNKEAELKTAQASLDNQEAKLNAAMQLLDEQQVKLENVIGVRTQIIRDLVTALADANLKVGVDESTGDIMLESTVLFTTNGTALMQEGKDFLDSFIPIYLSVLLSDEYIDDLSEIVIEGHTDSSGSYLTNLEISRNRAANVAEYCLGNGSLTESRKTLFEKYLTIVARSESDLIYNEDGTENMDASRRVEFKFRLKDSDMISEILNILSDNEP